MEESWIQHLIPDGPHCSHFGLSGNLNHTRQTKLSSFQQAASNLEEAMASSSLSLFSYFTSFFLWHPQWHFSYCWQAASAAAAGSLSRRRRQPLRAPLSLAYAYLEPQARRNIWGRLVFVPTKFCT
jgi:hypothetical protein